MGIFVFLFKLTYEWSKKSLNVYHSVCEECPQPSRSGGFTERSKHSLGCCIEGMLCL